MKKIEDYLHLYKGCEVEVINLDYKGGGYRGIMQSVYYGRALVEHSRAGDDWEDVSTVKPILRPLSDMKKGEVKEYNKRMTTLFTMADQQNQIRQEAECTAYLLSEHFDLFGLIEAGLAIDKTTL